MIKEVYCSDEVCKLLKEKGFNQPCIGLSRILCKEGENPIMKVTHQKAMKWLREVHHIHISVTIGCDVDNSNYIFYWAGIAKFTESSVDYIDPFEDTEFKSHEEAVEAALKYSLENLI